MLSQRWLTWTAPALAAAALAFTPGTSSAQHRGGGGGHSPGFSGGHSNGGSAYHANTYGGGNAYRGGNAYYRGGNNNYYRNGYGNNPYYGGYNRGYYGGYNRGYYGGYGSYVGLGFGVGSPYGYGYGYNSPSYTNNFYADAFPGYASQASDTNVYGTAQAPQQNYQSFYAGPAAQPAQPTVPAQPAASPAHLNVVLPAGGTVSFGTFNSDQPAGAKLYETPALTPGGTYTYTVQAKWAENGREVIRTKTARFQAGERITVDFSNATNG